MFNYDATGIEMNQGFPLIADGWFPFQIFDVEDGTSKNGHHQVLVKAACLDPRFKDRSVWHWVTFLPKDQKGAGMTIHFLKCINQPYEGFLSVDSTNWKGQKFMGKVFTDTYNGKKNNKFAAISPYRDALAPLETPDEPTQASVQDDNEIPF